MGATNLLLHYFPRVVFRSDFDGMAERVRALAPDIHVDVLATDRSHPLAVLRAATRPTVSVEFNHPKFPRVLRGKIYRHWRKGAKSRQYRVMEQAGLPVPRWVDLTPETKLDPEDWGKYVVLKPDLGMRGAYVRVNRTARVRYRPPEELEEDNPARKGGGMLVQRLVYTGDHPVSYRVVTLLGTPLFAKRYEGSRAPSFTKNSSGALHATGSSVVATGVGCKVTLCDDPEILDLARRTHAAFPDIPVLGIDLARDLEDGSLWVLEVNPDGGTWALGSPGGKKLRESTGLDLYGQFGALDRAAEALVEACRLSAA
ncbi:MAG: hypothetical protein AAF414_15420 [Pseudomonadota bacterium]